MATIKHHIPVADAGLLTKTDRLIAAPTRPAKEGSKPAWFFVGLIWLNTFCFLGVFVASGGLLETFAIFSRYILWIMILAGAAMHIMSRGGGVIGRNMAIVMPFFAIGSVSAIFGFNFVTSLQQLTFWMLGVVSASVISAELPQERIMRTLFTIMLVLMGGSILLAVLAPDMAVGIDKRGLFGGGSWNGVFVGKNTLGSIAGYALVFCVFVPGRSMLSRLLLAALASICMLFSGSQGSIVIAFGTAAFVGVVWFLRSTSLSTGARASVLLAIVVVVIPLSMMLSGFVLELLGRDTTLTGRTDIWRAFLDRALDYWLIGAGPGSFTTASWVTIDLSVALAKFGSIYTPHNMFIAVLGETGIFGLVAYVSVLFYAAFVLPFRNDRPIALATAAVAFMTAIGGIGETREVFGPAFMMFLLIIMLSLSRQAEEAGVAPDPRPADPDVRPVDLVPDARPRIPVLGRP